MTRKHHLQHTALFGPTCQKGRAGFSLRGEHITEPFDGFVARPVDLQCSRCLSSNLFSFLNRKENDKWIPEDPDAWKRADDALIARNRANI